MKVLTIERAKWRRGGDTPEKVAEFGETVLLNDSGLMCCLGFDAHACGIPKKNLLGVGNPSDLAAEDLVRHGSRYAQMRLVRRVDRWVDNGAVLRAIKANDSRRLSERQREARIRRELKSLGWDDVRFV